MKKLTYLILGLIVLGGVIFAFSRTSLFKGNLNLPVTEELTVTDLEPVRIDGEEGDKTATSSFDIEDFLPETDNAPVSSELEDRVEIIPVEVTDKNGTPILNLNYKDFIFYNQAGTPSQITRDHVKEEDGNYKLNVDDGAARQVEIVIDGYVVERSSFIDPVKEADADKPYEISLKHSIKINVEDEKGNGIKTEATVTANTADCPRLVKDPSSKGYGCAISEKVVNIDYTVNLDGYLPESGTFENDGDPKTQQVYTVTMTPLASTTTEPEPVEEPAPTASSLPQEPEEPGETEPATACIDLQLSMVETDIGATLTATGEASAGIWEGELVFTSNGLGLFDENNIPVSGLTFNSTVEYTHEAGTTTELGAYIVDEEIPCTADTSTLTVTPAADTTPATTPSTDDQDEEDDAAETAPVSTPTPTPTTPDDQDDEPSVSTPTPTTTTTPTPTPTPSTTPTTTTTPSTSTLADCEDPFIDTGDIEEWPGKYVCPSYGKTVDGKTPTIFEPYSLITRSEWLKVIIKTAGYTVEDADGLSESFLDVNATDWEYPYVKIAEDLDVIRTRDFGPYWNGDVPITRGDAVLYAVRLAKLTNYDINLSFKDVPSDYYAAYAIDLAYETFVDFAEEGLVRVVQGYDDNTFRPYTNMTRAEAVTMALRMSLAWFEGVIDFNL